MSEVNTLKRYQLTLNKYAPNSPIKVSDYYYVCKKTLNYPDELCATYFGIMYAESHFGTEYYKPIEKYYWNYSGYKSAEIIKTHKADKNGSWLRQFNFAEEYYRITLEKFYLFYWTNGGSQLRTPEKISRKWVGNFSRDWINAVNKIKKEL